MTKKDWDEALNGLDPDLVEEYVANLDACPRKKSTRPYWFAAVAAVLVLAIGIGALPEWSGSPGTNSSNHLLAKPVYPVMAQYPILENYKDYDSYDRAYAAWRDDQRQQYDQPEGYAESLTAFFQRSMAQFLQGSDNATYSPLNVYMAMAMLAETTDGNSRQQILDLFGLETIEQLREQASQVWNAHYCADGQTSLLLANSLWLDSAYNFKEPTANLLADRYFASSFRGDLNTDEMNQLLHAWLNENTGNLLKEEAQNVNFNPQTVFALASTIHFTASWVDEFDPENTKDGIFHGSEGDRAVPFMNRFLLDTLYWGEHFTAVRLRLTGNNWMWLILPDEGYTVADVLESGEYLQMTLNPGSRENAKRYGINLSLPKFDVSDQKDLVDGMKALGLTDIFDSTVSDFIPLADTPELYVSTINHAARVAIDEQGFVGAAFTVIMVELGSAPSDPDEIDFTLDRPFLFVVSSRDNLPLFAGIVNEP